MIKLLKARDSLLLALLILVVLLVRKVLRTPDSAPVREQVLSKPTIEVRPSRIEAKRTPVVQSIVSRKRIELPDSTSFESKPVVEKPKDTTGSLPEATTKSRRSSQKFAYPSDSSSSWSDFVSRPFVPSFDRRSSAATETRPLNPHFKPILCPPEIAEKLAKPMLSDEDFKWCKWAISPTGAGVVVGKSWGKLRTKREKERFDALNCNIASSDKNPSCDDSWGDIQIQNWLSNPVPKAEFSCDAGKTSQEVCYQNANTDVYCVLKNAQIDFSKFTRYERPGTTASKKWRRDFISTDCNGRSEEPVFPFKYLYSPQLSSQRCDFTYNGTLLLYSHDDIRNLAHTLNDVFNVWVMLWLSGAARQARQVDMLNVDSFKHGHNFDDQPNHFFLTYEKSLRSILKGQDYAGKTLCVQELLIQPIPPRFFMWESWFADLPCSFVGPSSLYQRWNMHVRHSFGLLTANSELLTEDVFRILLVVRNEKTNLWGASRTSRNFINTDDIKKSMEATVDQLRASFKDVGRFELVVQDLSTLSFEEQVKLISSTSIMIGVHGAGVSSSTHMPIGTKHCCGLLEIFPHGEYAPIRGFGNVARKMGLHYDRLDINSKDSQANGAIVPVKELSARLVGLVKTVHAAPTCVLSAVVEDPFLEKIDRTPPF